MAETIRSGRYQLPLSWKETLSLLKAYRMQRWHAECRGVEFRIDFVDWLVTWADSGHLSERGRRMDEYCMARDDGKGTVDKGAYEVGNVKIKTNRENGQEKEPDREACARGAKA
jgi:hypothetical protein